MALLRDTKAIKLLTAKDVSTRLGVGVDRVRALTREGRIAVAVVTSGGFRLYSEDAVQAFEQERLRAAKRASEVTRAIA